MGVMRNFLVSCALALIADQASACTLVALGRKATVDGSVIVLHTDDNGGTVSDLRLVRVPAMDHPPGSKRAVYRFHDQYPRVVTPERGPGYAGEEGDTPFEPLGYIPQVAHTYAYFDADYGMANEKQLSISESTTNGKFQGYPIGEQGGNQMFFIDELSKLALERCDSARCAVRTMGDAAVQYGFYASSCSYGKDCRGDAAETLAIGDKYGEAWIFTVMAGPNNSSAVWVAQRVPDDHVAVVANGYMYRGIDLNDTDNFMGSDNLYSAAIDAGFWSPDSGKPFDFSAAYGYIADDAHTSALYVGRRVWRIYSWLAPSKTWDPYVGWFPTHETYPFSVQVDKPVDMQTLFDIMKDTYEGTEFDMSKGLGAGPWGYPHRYGGNRGVGGWERSISIFRTLWSFAIQSRPDMPDEVGGLVWYGPDAPVGSVWLPVYASAPKLSPALDSWGKMSVFNSSSIWWTFHFLNDWAARKYSLMMVDIREVQKKLQDESLRLTAEWEKKALEICSKDDCDEKDSQDARDLLARESAQWMETVREQWWDLTWKMVAKYQSGYIITAESPEGTKPSGYPMEWLNKTEWIDWPPTNTYKPPEGADKTWNSIVKKREEAAKGKEGESNNGVSWIRDVIGFMLGAVVGVFLYYVTNSRYRRHGYTPL